MPRVEAKRCEQPSEGVAEVGQERVVHEVFANPHELAVVHAVAGKEPHDDRGEQDDGTGFLDERPCALPHAAQQVDETRQTVLGQFHDVGGGLAPERLHLLQDDAAHNDGGNSHEVRKRGNPPYAAENGGCDERDDRKLRRARHERSRHDGQMTRRFGFDGARSHDAGYATASADDHGDERFAGQAEAAEQTVENERDARHVAAALQDSEQEEQDHDLRDETEHGAHASHDAVHDQVVEPVNATDRFKQSADQNGNARNPDAVLARLARSCNLDTLRNHLAGLFFRLDFTIEVVDDSFGSLRTAFCLDFFIAGIGHCLGLCLVLLAGIDEVLGLGQFLFIDCRVLGYDALASCFRFESFQSCLGLGRFGVGFETFTHCLKHFITWLGKEVRCHRIGIDALLSSSVEVVCNCLLRLVVRLCIGVVCSLGARIGVDNCDGVEVPAIAEHAIVRPVRRVTTDRAHGDVVDGSDDDHEDGKSKHAIEQDAVDFRRRAHFGLVLLLNLIDKTCDVVVAFVADHGISAVAKTGFDGTHMTVEVGNLAQLGKHFLVALEVFDGVVALQLGVDAFWKIGLEMLDERIEVGRKRCGCRSLPVRSCFLGSCNHLVDPVAT